MDIRVTAYNPVTVSTFSNKGNPFATSVVQNANTSGPVQAIQSLQGAQGNTRTANAGGNGGYTDTIRGSLINILA